MKTRHLVLDSEPSDIAAGRVAIACAQTTTPVPYDAAQHTYLTALTALTTCSDCRTVHAAWAVVFIASLDLPRTA